MIVFQADIFFDGSPEGVGGWSIGSTFMVG